MSRIILLLFFLVAARLLGQPVLGDDFRQQDSGLDSREAVDGSVVGLQIHNTEPHAAASTNETADIEFYFDTDLVAKISIIKLDDYVPGPGEDDSAMVFYTDRDGTLTEAMRLLSTGGVRSSFFVSTAADPADAGSAVRLGNTECVGWELATPGADATLCLNAADEFEFSLEASFSAQGMRATSGSLFLKNGTGSLKFAIADNHLLVYDDLYFNSDDANDIGENGTTRRPRTIFVGTSISIGSGDGTNTLEVENDTPTTGKTTVVIKAGDGNTTTERILSFFNSGGTEQSGFANDGKEWTFASGGPRINWTPSHATGFTLKTTGNFTQTGTTVNMGKVQGVFAPTSGTAIFNGFEINTTINQTGGANGISRGFYCNPTLTASADFRCIDIALGGLRYSSGGTFGTGTGPSYGDGDTECFESADDIWQCTTAGTANGFQLDATGDLTPIGIGTIDANRYNGNAVIDEADLDTNVVLDNAANTYGAFAQDFSSASMTLPTSQTLTTPTISGTGFTNAQHAHLGATSGGQLTAPALPNSIRDMKASFNVPAPVTGDDGDFQVEFPAACTLIEVACNVQAATSVTINLYERARATPETGTTNMITTSPICVTGGDVETAFDDAALAANVPLALGISAVSGTPALLRVHVTCRRD